MKVTYSNLGNEGRLGNHLWQIASTFGLAEKHGADVMFNHWDYEPFFQIPADYFVDDPWGTEASDLALHLPKSERVYLQDYNLWERISETIRLYFQPSDLAREQLREYDSLKELPNRVAIHVRRDERSQFQASHPTPPREYYQQAMAMELMRLGDVSFCVFSDDIEWCKKNFPPYCTFVEGYPRLQDNYGVPGEPEWRDYLDIFLMSECVGHIIPNSTFSWWGAFLSKNRSPLYPAVWYGPALKHVDWRLQIPPGWREVGW